MSVKEIRDILNGFDNRKILIVGPCSIHNIDEAKISKNVKIGPYCVIDSGVTIAEDNELISHVHITGNTKIGKNNKFFPFCLYRKYSSRFKIFR